VAAGYVAALLSQLLSGHRCPDRRPPLRDFVLHLKRQAALEAMNGDSVDTALYFPYINVPEESWFTQILLYWDHAASIVPDTLIQNREELGPYTVELMDEGLVHSVAPRDVLRNMDAFSEGFVELLATHRPPAGIGIGAQLLHEEKMNRRVYQAMQERGVAQPLSDSGGWWMVEPTTAALYMGYLTGAMCGARRDLFPVTNSSEMVAFLAPPAPDMATRLQSLRYEVLSQALPAPSRPISAVQIKDFKEGHGDDLRRLRRFLSGQLAVIAEIEDPYLREARKDGIFQEIEDQVARLREQMSRRDWPRIIAVGIAGVAAAAIATVGAIITPGSAMIHGLEIGAAALSVSPAAVGAADTVRPRQFDRNSPLVYAAAVAKNL
jgi:hypothetical protein